MEKKEASHSTPREEKIRLLCTSRGREARKASLENKNTQRDDTQFERGFSSPACAALAAVLVYNTKKKASLNLY